MKTCNTCGRNKPLEQFPRMQKCKDGHLNFCNMCRAERKRTYRRADKEVMAAHTNGAYEWKKRNRDKVLAHKRVHYHVKVGNIKRPETCESCKEMCKVQGHHDDYSKQLDVKWLCQTCHQARHLEQKAIMVGDNNA